MKKIKSLLGLFLVLSLIMMCWKSIDVYAQEGGIVVTHEMIGDNNTTQTVRITNKVIEIEDGAFSGLTALKQIIVDSDNPYYASYGGCLYNKDYTVLMCIPQNTTSVQIKTSITSYTPHALDGLAQSRIDALNQYLGTSGPSSYESPTNNTTNDTNYNNDTPSNPIVNQPSNNTNTDFSQYVYNEGGDVCFKYTGSGESSIIVPEGVTKITGFSDSAFKLNNDITYIYLPSTLESMRTFNIFALEDDNNFYNCLYQCPNLRTVEGGSYSYQCNGSSVTRPGNITVWSSSGRYKYDVNQYYNYNK